MGSPLTKTMTKCAAADAEDVQVSAGGQDVGKGEPPLSGGPAMAESESAHSSTHAVKNRLIGSSSPLVVVTLSAGFTGRAPHDTPVDPGSFALWRTYLAGGQLRRAADLCRERLLSAKTEKERDCWVKDLSIVKMAAGEYQSAFDLSLTLRARASRYEGSFRGRLEVNFARAHANLLKFDPAFEHYTAGHFYAEQAGDSYLAAQIDTNTGRCYTSARRPEDSHEYFDRAHAYALKSEDILLQGEIDESRALAFEAEGLLLPARKVATRSLSLLTDFELAYGETKRTLDRIDAKLIGAR
jgi:tetratricopeptide (TPR) repeat protein